MTNGEKIQTILDIDRDCTEVYGENGTMTFTITQDFWNAKYKESTVENNLGIDDEERELALMYLEQIKDDYIEGVGYEKHPLPEYYAIETAMKSLALPSVTPQEPSWIPVTERLPEPNRLVLCYITIGTTETYFLALWNDTLNAWEEGIGGYRLLENDLGYEVIAWMPLPEPYNAESVEV